jgi:propanol-preferring alcohol dehydrogenase
VLLRVLAAGVCHTDLYFMSMDASRLPFRLPATMGHEGVGVVEELGPGVTEAASGLIPDQPYAVFAAWGCGQCGPCARGAENYCTRAARLGIRPPGLGTDGAMADYLLVDDSRHLVSIGELPPTEAVALTDAVLTPYHAIKGERDRLGPGSMCVVIGIGGLGHAAVQVLRATTETTIVAVDVRAEKLALATSLGAEHAWVADATTAAAILDLTGGVGADVVLDFVGTPETTTLSLESSRINGSIVMVGSSGGVIPIAVGSTPYGLRARSVYWGGLDDLHEVVSLAQQGVVKVHAELHPLVDAAAVYDKLAAGQVTGRAVLVP